MGESEAPQQPEAPEPPNPPDADGAKAEGAAELTTRRAPIGPDGMERPKFLLDYPEDPALERLIAAFETGNYALIRRDAEAVAKAAEDPAVSDAARELRRRIDPDPLAKYLLGVAMMLLVYLVIWAYRHGAP
jgi:hypothetical protein